MKTHTTKLEAELGTWPGVVTESARFDCCEFTLGTREIGRLQGGARVEIPFEKHVRDVLLETTLDLSIHGVYPNSGWVTYELDGAKTLDRALAFLRLSYLCHVATLQQHGTTDQELSLIDVATELETVDVPASVREHVREAFSLDRSDEDQRVATEPTSSEADTATTDDESRAETGAVQAGKQMAVQAGKRMTTRAGSLLNRRHRSPKKRIVTIQIRRREFRVRADTDGRVRSRNDLLTSPRR